MLALVLNIAFSEFTDDFQIVGNMLCLWQTSWEIYECNKPPVLQGSLNKLTRHHNENSKLLLVVRDLIRLPRDGRFWKLITFIL